MDKVEQLKELLKELTPEEVEQFKAFLNSEDEEPSEEVVQNDETETEPTKEDGNNTEEFDDASEEGESEEEVAQADEIPSESVESLKKEETQQEETEEDKSFEESLKEQPVEEQAPIAEEDDIPKMQKSVECSEGVTESQPITDENGENIPIDYEQIVEGLNARIAALEAENASLKNKVDGAFGYSAKPAMPVKTNRLYDECSDVHFHK